MEAVAARAELESLARRIAALEQAQPGDRLCMVVFSGELDRQLAALIIATGAASAGMEVELFFTFWATASLRDPKKKPPPKSLLGRLFGWVLPRGTRKLKLSKMQMMGMGPALLKRMMKNKGVASVEDLLEIAGELGVKIHICTMSMDLMEFDADEFIDYPHLSFCGVASFVELTDMAKTTLFI